MNHSYLGASVMHCRMACKGSYNLSKRSLMPEGSDASDLGDAMHWVGETCLRDSEIDPLDFDGGVSPSGVKLKESDLQSPQFYVEYVRNLLTTLGLPQGSGKIEERVDLSWVDEEMFGTGDFAIGHLDTYYSVDFKNGHDPVEASENPQLVFYLLGGYPHYEKYVGIICQPNAGGIKRYEFTRDDLTAWIQRFRDIAAACREPNAPRVPGEHCKHCPAKAICPENRVNAWKLYDATRDFYDKTDIEDEIDAIDAAIEALKHRKTTLDTAAYHLAYNEGVQFQRHKLVRSVTQRKWRDESAIIAWCELNNIDPFEKKLLTPAKLSRNIDTTAYEEKPEGKVKLVHNSKRGTPVGSRTTERFRDVTGGIINNTEGKS